MSKPSSRDSLAASSKAYKEIEAEVRANYPSEPSTRENAPSSLQSRSRR